MDPEIEWNGYYHYARWPLDLGRSVIVVYLDTTLPEFWKRQFPDMWAWWNTEEQAHWDEHGKFLFVRAPKEWRWPNPPS